MFSTYHGEATLPLSNTITNIEPQHEPMEEATMVCSRYEADDNETMMVMMTDPDTTVNVATMYRGYREAPARATVIDPAATIDLKSSHNTGILNQEETIECFQRHHHIIPTTTTMSSGVTLQTGATTMSPMENIHVGASFVPNKKSRRSHHVSNEILMKINHLRQEAENEGAHRRQVIAAQCPRFGELKRVASNDPLKRGGKYSYKFQDGLAIRQVERNRTHYEEQLVEIQAEINATRQSHSSSPQRIQTLELMRVNMENQLTQVCETLKSLRKERTMHIQESHALLMEEESPFATRPVLANRYILIKLLGRGGFCEVWKVYDLIDDRECAAKLHKNYAAARSEYAIQHQLHHPNIAEIYGDLIIGDGPFDGYFVIIMELVDSNLLTYLKMHGALSETESRLIVSQIMSALAYLNQSDCSTERITHYDLKPENLLMTRCGQIKLTDFGLSKYSQEGAKPNGVAGTYWYLPPECFTPTYDIGSKIDVWAIGVIFYQLMYGHRPFGEGMTQRDILKKKVILQATQVVFPDVPEISEESKDFVRRCLTFNPAQRPDVRTLCGMN